MQSKTKIIAVGVSAMIVATYLIGSYFYKKTKSQPSVDSSAADQNNGLAVKKNLMTLYGYWRSGCTWRVRLVLALKGFHIGDQIEYIPVNLISKDGGEHKQEAYTKINPSQVSRVHLLQTLPP